MKTYAPITIILIVTISVFFLTRTDQDKEETLLSEEKEELLYSAEDENKTEEIEALNDTEEDPKDEVKEPGSLHPIEEDSEEPEEEITAANGFIQCLADAGLIIYGSRTCSACKNLAEQFGGYEAINAIYVECSNDWDRCSSAKQTNYVPEIQIKGELYTDTRTLEKIGEVAGCEYN